MMMTYVTLKGKAALQKRLDEKLQRLKEIQKEKAHAYNASGDGWHDNPGWVQLGQQEEMLSTEIGHLQKKLSEVKIVEISPENIDQVQLGVSVTFKQANKVSGKSNTYKFLIATDGEADVRKGIISNNSPLGTALIGMKVTDCKTVVLPAGEFEICVLKIEME